MLARLALAEAAVGAVKASASASLAATQLALARVTAEAQRTQPDTPRRVLAALRHAEAVVQGAVREVEGRVGATEEPYVDSFPGEAAESNAEKGLVVRQQCGPSIMWSVRVAWREPKTISRTGFRPTPDQQSPAPSERSSAPPCEEETKASSAPSDDASPPTPASTPSTTAKPTSTTVKAVSSSRSPSTAAKASPPV